MARWIRNELNGHWSLAVPHRRDRPQGPQPCAFCPGAEAHTPPTLDQEPASGSWTSRAFANAFPIVDRHEVIVDTPLHVTGFADLAPAHARSAVKLWARRMRAARATGATPLLYRNDGAAAGASVPHAHAQLVASPDTFPRVAHEADVFTKRSPFARPDFFRTRQDRDGWTIGKPRAARFAGETWILPVEASARFEDSPAARLDAFAGVLLEVTSSLTQEGLSALNVILHTAPEGSHRFHWHAEILPRRDGIAGFELGAGVFANAGP